MSTKEPKSIKSLLSGEFSELAALGKKAQDHLTLVQRVSDSLPEILRNHVFAADIDRDILTIVCDSAVWATRIRFYSQTLLENFAPDHNSTITRVIVKVRPRWRPN